MLFLTCVVFLLSIVIDSLLDRVIYKCVNSLVDSNKILINPISLNFIDSADSQIKVIIELNIVFH